MANILANWKNKPKKLPQIRKLSVCICSADITKFGEEGTLPSNKIYEIMVIISLMLFSNKIYTM